jgi:ribose-phosphate pyrophosphokinase
MNAVILALPGNERIARDLARMMELASASAELRHFPDGETYLRINSPVADRTVVLVCTLDRPDEKFLPLSFLAATARDLGAAKVGLVSPYLAYMRQDKRFHPGEAITSAYFGALLGRVADWLVTVDPHLHRRRSLSEVFPVPARAVHAAPAISAWIRKHVQDPILIGPDAESEQWVESVAEGAGAPHVVLEKIRRGDRDVEVSVPAGADLADRTPVLVDDIISTGRTMMATISHLKEAGFPPAVCIGVHAIFADAALEELRAAGAARVVTCNTIPHETNAIDIVPLLADGIRSFLS